jgi:hypothetical protein
MAIYVSEYAGYSPLRSNGKAYAQFRPYECLDPERGSVKKGVLVLHDEKDKELIAELEAFPDFNHGFKKVSKLPMKTNSDGNIITGVKTMTPRSVESQIDTQSIIKKAERVGQLKAQLFKNDGSIRADVKPEDERITELENLEQELKKE